MVGRILVIDGVPTNRITMKVRLRSACYEVAVAASGQEAIRIARQTHPQMVLIGRSLPDMSGAALCAEMRRLPLGADLPILIQATGAERVATLRAGASALIEPDGDELALLARIRGLLRHDGEVTREDALTGMAEPAAGFEHDSRPQAVFVGNQPATALGWRHALQGRVGFRITVSEAERALAEASVGRAPDLYLIAADIQQPGDGLRLLSELRSRPHSREAAFVIALRPERADMIPVALDLGAGDVLPWNLASPEAAPEAAIRLDTQLARKHQADRRRHETQRNMRWAMTDPLTGLHNRRFALPRLHELAVETGESGRDLAVMVLDLDRFKLVNDMHGHAAGDAVLAEIAARLAASLPEAALLARLGGEEFLAILPDCPMPAARRIAEDMRRAVMSAPVRLPDGSGQAELGVTISAGVAVLSAAEAASAPPDAEALLARADHALLAAKSSGRNRIVMAPLSMAA
ncbi:response regulator receiver modulated diguanylate cyclase [Paracoccus halophilus]|uniref:diguanylate cyclase n=1 Tax=Paracoccus halophilus TaxID=376733 RepID=A0A099F053_9RHOB|nr:diguanylate cyclase [Paracoccus halophilus]KGJ03626.1 diguanylate cyclase [Paracoccus halophilus]SFA58002.1 response regulator receiver modulated diguanylate cyclase [Paracoccus halophilus]